MTVSAAFAATAATAATAAFTMTFAIATAVLAMTTAAFTRHRLDQLRHFFLRGPDRQSSAYNRPMDG